MRTFTANGTQTFGAGVDVDTGKLFTARNSGVSVFDIASGERTGRLFNRRNQLGVTGLPLPRNPLNSWDLRSDG